MTRYMENVNASCFTNCYNMINCTSSGANSTHPSSLMPGFWGCKDLTNCYATGINTGYYECENLSQCVGDATFATAAFHTCKRLAGCTAYTTAWNKYLDCFMDQAKLIPVSELPEGGWNI